MKQSQQRLNIWIGALTIAAFLAAIIFSYRHFNRPSWSASGVSTLYADVQNVGDLKRFSPVKIGGVEIGYVQKIMLDPKTLRARIELKISREVCMQLPVSTELKIVSCIPFGETFITLGVSPRVLSWSKSKPLKDGDTLIRVVPYQSLEDFIESCLTTFTSNVNEKK